MLIHAPEEIAMTTPKRVPPNAALVQLLFGKHIAYCVSAVARLGVADYIDHSPVEVETLASKVGAQPDALYRVMRLLAGAGVFEEWRGRQFRLTEVGELLRSDVPASMRYTAMQMGDVWSTRPWEHFANTVVTGTDGVTQAFGKNAFEYLAEEPEQAEHFHRSMTGYSASMMDAIVRGYDFSGIRRLADVGGGHGQLMAAVLDKHPAMRGVVYDLPEVAADGPGQRHLAGCADRIEFQGGSFFERVPSGCDAYMMKFILHDWSDEHCKTILRLIREQLASEGRVLVLEQVVTAEPGLCFAKLLDIEMLALTVGGRERTEADFRELFRAAGLKLTNVFPTGSPMCIVEGRAA
jgi:hypothetical protein